MCARHAFRSASRSPGKERPARPSIRVVPAVLGLWALTATTGWAQHTANLDSAYADPGPDRPVLRTVMLEAWRSHADGDLEAALDRYAKALILDPGYVPALVLRAEVMRGWKRYELAREELARARDLDPADPGVRRVERAIASDIRRIRRSAEAQRTRARREAAARRGAEEVARQRAEARRRVEEAARRRAEARARQEAAERQQRPTTVRGSQDDVDAECQGPLSATEMAEAVEQVLRGEEPDVRPGCGQSLSGATGDEGSLGQLARAVQEMAEQMGAESEAAEAELQALLRQYQREAERVERERREAERRQREQAAAERRRQAEARQEAARRERERQQREAERGRQRTERGRDDRAGDGEVARIRVRVAAEDEWTTWSRVPGQPNLWVRATISEYNESAEKYMWWVQFRNGNSEQVCHSYGIGPVGAARATARHWLSPGEREGVWFLVPVGPGQTAEIVSERFELEDGCF